MDDLMNMSKFKKRLMQLGIVTAMTMSLTGCSSIGWSEISTHTDNAETAFNQVRDRNLEYITLMENQGLLSTSQAEDWRNSVTTKMNNILTTFKNGDTDIVDENGKKISSKAISEKLTQAITPETVQQHKSMSSMYYSLDGTVSTESFNIVIGHDGDHEMAVAEPGTFYIETHCTEDIEEDQTCGETYHKAVSLSMFNAVNTGMEYLEDVGGGLGKPFELYDATQVEQLKNALSRPIYVINNFNGANKSPEKLQLALAILQKDVNSAKELMLEFGLSDAILGKKTLTGMGLDTIKNYDARYLIENMENLSDEEVKAVEEYVLSYCTPAKDENGNNVTFLKVNTYKSGERVAKDGTPYIFADTEYDYGRHIGTDGSVTAAQNGLGRDLAVTSDGKVSILIRFMEFNPELLDALGAKENNGSLSVKGKYYITDQADKAAIKLDYPLYKIESIKTSSVGSKDWWCTIADTGMYMDLSDGTFYDDEHYRLNYKNNFYSMRSVMFWNHDTVDPKDSNSVKITDKVGEGQVEVPVRPLVLREYVELYQIQDDAGNGISEDNEYWTALGRRLRVKKFEGSAEDINEFAQSLNTLRGASMVEKADENGEVYQTVQQYTGEGWLAENPNYISLSDIADRVSGYGYMEKVMMTLGLGINNNSELAEALKDGSENLAEVVTAGMTLSGNVDVTDKEIKPIVCMGSEAVLEEGAAYDEMVIPLAQNDHNKVYEKVTGGTYQCPTIYGICISSGITEANLTGGNWIGSTVDSCYGIQSWNKWLTDNNFSYQVNIDKILELLGIEIDMLEKAKSEIIFEPEIIEQIMKDREEAEASNAVRLLRTWSRIFGFVISAYALFLMGAWTIDVNIYGGPKFLTIMTGGKWIAVRDADDYSEIGDESKYYIDLRRLIMSVCAIMAIGCMLTFIDFYDLRRIVQKYSGAFAETVRKLLIE